MGASRGHRWGPGLNGRRTIFDEDHEAFRQVVEDALGEAGASLDETVVIILGGANLVADGFSMAVSNFLGSRAERQQRERARREEVMRQVFSGWDDRDVAEFGRLVDRYLPPPSEKPASACAIRITCSW